MDSRMQSNIQN